MVCTVLDLFISQEHMKCQIPDEGRVASSSFTGEYEISWLFKTLALSTNLMSPVKIIIQLLWHLVMLYK